MTVDDLKSLLPPPQAPVAVPTPEQWQEAERELGVSLPTDYKAYLAAFGVGRIDDFLWIYSPAAKNQYANAMKALSFEQQAAAYLKARRMERGAGAPPYEVFPATPGLLPFGATDNGDMLYWVVARGSDPSEWPIAVRASREDELEIFNLSLTAFLAAVLRRQVEPDAFPDGFPADVHRYEPARAP